MRELRIVYMGTPDFAVYPLQKLLEAGHKVATMVQHIMAGLRKMTT